MKVSTLLITLLFLSVCVQAQNFEEYFINKSLRMDYVFTGNFNKQQISLKELSQLPSWAGKRHHLSTVPLLGNGEVIMRDVKTQKCIYKMSFSSLFQEWLSTDQAKTISRSFENTYILPYPIAPVEVEISLFYAVNKVAASMKTIINPKDILIKQKGLTHITPHKYLIKNGDEKECIDIAILAEGYTSTEMNLFYQDAEIACESIFSHEPFKSMKKKFNVVAVASPSVDSGVSIPHLKEWKETAFGSHFDTFYSKRYLTSTHLSAIHDALAGIPYEHIIILANTEQYGGGGVYNAFTLTTAHHSKFRPVVVHEFGHSFGGLADEYFYDGDVMDNTYPLNVEPWEPNITTQVDFASKWKDMLEKDTPIPTPIAEKEKYPIGVYEGAGYSAKGIYRGSYDCRMRTNECPAFCPICQRALKRLINFYTQDK
ncbi:IgA Peptidase M64 [uncultured Bacteroides sp.]|uniref:IgA Peptidase M64 n=1 Tax=uncultured Bacteroides sp. TaxID=162156 RepID=UPI002AAA9744|nr:IgA Peptidase M64 [uncultured Bacteroides sp.]